MTTVPSLMPAVAPPPAGALAAARPRRAAPAAGAAQPAWVRDAVVYAVVPPKFGRNGFADVTARLDEIRSLGTTVIWLSPVTAATPGDYGYEVTGHDRLRPEFGTAEQLKTLVRESHRRGMRVILDFVPNHTSVEHPWYQDVLDRGRRSPWYHHYQRDRTGAVQHYFDWDHLPNLDYDNPAVRRGMKDAFAYWVREFDVDGFRVDVAWGVRERRPSFWPELRRELEAIKPELFMLAEAPARDPWYARNGFDVAYDWTPTFKWSWEGVFDGPTANVDRLHRALVRDFPGGGAGAADGARAAGLVMRFLDNNDLGAGFRSRHGVRMARLGAALVATLPGIPMIYTGTEIGARFDPYRNDRPLSWNDPDRLRHTWRELLRVRRELPALRSDEWKPLRPKGQPDVYGYLRGVEGSGSEVLVLHNFGGATKTIDAPGAWARDALTGQRLVREADADSTSVALPGYATRVLTRT